MDISFSDTVLFDLATYALYGFFASFGFMTWYLKKYDTRKDDREGRYTNWVELIFRFRDCSRKQGSVAHAVYHLSIIFLGIIVTAFIVGMYGQLQGLDNVLRNVVAIACLVIFIFIAKIVYKLSQNKYYDDW